MHGDADGRMEEFDNLNRLIRINRIDSSDRAEKDIDLSDFPDQGIRRNVAKIPKVQDPKMIDFIQEKDIVPAESTFLIIVIGREALDDDIPDLIPAFFLNHLRIA